MKAGYARMALIAMAMCMPSLFAGELQHDVFARPSNLTQLPPINAADMAGREDAEPWNGKLIAIMVAGKNSLVNVDGEIIKLGELKDGYRLVKVRDHLAVFRKGKKRIVLKMDVLSLGHNKERGNK